MLGHFGMADIEDGGFASTKWRRNVEASGGNTSLYILLVGIVVLLMPLSARADRDGYLDSWEGAIQVQYKHKSEPPQSVPPYNAKLKSQIDDFWIPSDICRRLEDGIPHTRWWSCIVPDYSAAEMRGKSFQGTSRIYIKYIVRGNRVSFDSPTDTAFGSYADPTINAQFDMEIDLFIDFDQFVNGVADSSKPAVASNVSLHFSGATFSSPQIYVTPGQLHDGERKMNAKVITINPPDMSSINGQFHTAANQLLQLAETGASAHFRLDAWIDPSPLHYFVLQFKRDQDAPAPPVCTATVGCGPEVTLQCPFDQGTALYTLERAKPIQGKIASMFAQTVWLPVASAQFALVSDESSGPAERFYRMCETTDWGTNCSDPVGFHNLPTSEKCVSGGSTDGPPGGGTRRCHAGLFGRRICVPLAI